MITRNRFIACFFMMLSIIREKPIAFFHRTVAVDGYLGYQRRWVGHGQYIIVPWIEWSVWRTFSSKRGCYVYKTQLRSRPLRVLHAWLLIRVKPELRGANVQLLAEQL